MKISIPVGEISHSPTICPKFQRDIRWYPWRSGKTTEFNDSLVLIRSLSKAGGAGNIPLRPGPGFDPMGWVIQGDLFIPWLEVT